MTNQKRWRLILGVGATIALMIVISAFVFRSEWGYRELSGPVAIIQGDPPPHGFLGVDFDESNSAALTVQSVVEGSGADEAGLQPGDVVLAAAEIDHPDFQDLVRLLRTTAPGDGLVMKIARGSDQMTIRLRVISFSELILLREQKRLGGAE